MRRTNPFMVLTISFLMAMPVYSAPNGIGILESPMTEDEIMNMTLGELIERNQETWLKAAVMEGQMNRGFAIGTENFYPLKIYLSSTGIEISSSVIDHLDESENKTFKKLDREINAKVEDSISYYGYMQLGEEYYQLINADAAINGNECALKSDLVDYDNHVQMIEDENITGQISTITTYRDGTWISEGKLSIYMGPYKGDYKVLLEMAPAVKGPVFDISRINLVACCNPKLGPGVQPLIIYRLQLH